MYTLPLHFINIYSARYLISPLIHYIYICQNPPHPTRIQTEYLSLSVNIYREAIQLIIRNWQITQRHAYRRKRRETKESSHTYTNPYPPETPPPSTAFSPPTSNGGSTALHVTVTTCFLSSLPRSRTTPSFWFLISSSGSDRWLSPKDTTKPTLCGGFTLGPSLMA